MKGFIVIDGGGSKSETVVVDVLGHIVFHKIVTSSNPNDVGMNQASLTLLSVLKEAILIAKNKKVELIGIYLLIAGIEFGNSKEVLKSKLVKELKFEKIFIDGDLASVKEIGLADHENGVVIIAGTGFNMAIKKGNKCTNIGGWGYLADNYICGFDLGKDALQYASQSINNVNKSTLLVTLLENKYGNNLWYSMKQIYDGGIKEVASLSHLVVEAYFKNDKIAKKIVDERVKKLANIIKRKTRGLKDISITLFGGIFENNAFIVEKLKENLNDNYFVKVSNKKTIYGAVSLAYKMLLNIDYKKFYDCFDLEYKGVKYE